jgi:feruloyl-CoA synthase
MLFTTPKLRDWAGLPADAPLAKVLAHPKVLAHFQTVLNQLAANATGSANRVARMLLLSEPPSIDKGEVTDKGSINQRAVLKHRDALVQALHQGTAAHLLLPQA